jgi:hypothetical protein
MALNSTFGHYTNVPSAATTVIKSTRGALYAIIVNKAIASDTITIYDNTAASGTKIATVTFPGTLLANQLTLPYFCQFSTGLTVVTSGNSDITVIWQ